MSSGDSMMARQHAADVQALMAAPERLYSIEAVPVLEAFLSVQAKHPEVYDVAANLALLRAYLMWPELRKIEMIRDILCLALMRLQGPDFDLCLAQIPLALQHTDGILRALASAESTLQACRFSEFWDALDNHDPDLQAAAETKVGFRDHIRQFIAGVLSLTYNRVKLEDAMSLLHIDNESQMARFCEVGVLPPDVWELQPAPTVAESADAAAADRLQEQGRFIVITSATKSSVSTSKSSRQLFSPETLDETLSALKRMSNAK